MAHGPLIAILDAALRLPERASPEDEADVRRRIALATPSESSDFVIAVTSVERHGPHRIMADLLVFDGELMTVELRGDADDQAFMSMRWHAPDGAVALGLDPKAGVWRRVPGADPDRGLDPFARWDAQQSKLAEKAAKKKAAAARAAEARKVKRAEVAAAKAEAKAAAKAIGQAVTPKPKEPPGKPAAIPFADNIWW